MMLQLIDRGKIYLYLVLLLILFSIHNINSTNFINDFFKIKKIILKSSIEENINQEISQSLDQFYNFNIFSINPIEIRAILDNFNIISEYKIKKEYPSVIKIELKETNILAYYFNDNQKTYLGENGKIIKKKKFVKENLPLIVGQVDIIKFLDLKKKLINNEFKLDDFAKFYFFKSNRWDIQFKNKITVKLPIDDLDIALKLLKDIIKNSNLKDVKIIDLRIKKRIILS
tara:strand:- start:61 stop:747 length:687 start_codon:yes stop_codon:yes gene_type:complete